MTEIGLGHYLTLGAVIFSIGTIGIFLNRKNIIVILMSIELILLAVNINLVSFSIFIDFISGSDIAFAFVCKLSLIIISPVSNGLDKFET